MERIVAIGDIHGHNSWKRIIDKHMDDTDRFIFVGDYVDSFGVLPEDQLTNLLDIIAYAQHDPRVILLIGNHDYHYMDNDCDNERYSGFQPKMYQAFKEVYTDHKDLFRIAYIDENNTIYSHAGLSNSFLANVGIYSTDPKVIIDELNEIFRSKPSRFKFYPHDYGGYGNNINQSCLWIRPNSLIQDTIPFTQVVGHTPQNEIKYPKEHLEQIYFIDALPRQYLRYDTNLQIQTLEKQ